MTDRTLVEQIVRFAFFVRLCSLLLALLMPSDQLASWRALTALVFVTATSAVGLYWTRTVTAAVHAHPILLVIDVAVASSMAALLGSQSPLVIYSLSTAVLVGIVLRPRHAALVGSILVGAYLLITIVEENHATLTAKLLIPIAYVTVGVLSALARTLHETALAERDHAHRLIQEATRERERARLARDMHDSVAKSLHGIGLAAAALPTWAEKHPDEIAGRARALQQAAEVASQEARAILVGLRADEDDRTLNEQLRELVDHVDGVRATLEVEGIGDCDHTLRRELLAIAAEALENVQRHSNASNVAVRCTGAPREILLEVTDDGDGFDTDSTPEGHFGLVGMRERAATVRGTLEIATARGKGTTISVRTPRIQQIRGDS